MPYPTFSAGQRVTAALLTAAQPLTAYKAGDTSRASTTASNPDPDLTFAVEANATYLVDGYLIYGADPAVDIKLGFTGPASAIFDWNYAGQDGTQTGTSSPVITDSQSLGSFAYILGGVTNNAKKMQAKLSGTLRVSSTAGTFALVWAQQSSNATPTIVYAGSSLRLRRIA
jgi:hypothetical protein